jgi:hypothetical protein
MAGVTMAEGGVFDYVRANRALAGQLPGDDRVEVVAVDDATRSYWVVTSSELIALDGDVLSARYQLDCLRGEIATGEGGVTVRLTGPAGAVAVATFRRPNKLTDRLAGLLGPSPE